MWNMCLHTQQTSGVHGLTNRHYTIIFIVSFIIIDSGFIADFLLTHLNTELYNRIAANSSNVFRNVHFSTLE